MSTYSNISEKFDENKIPEHKNCTKVDVEVLTDYTAEPTIFEGRDEIVADIKSRLKTNKCFLIKGIGGIGKTEICRKIFWDYLNHPDNDVKYLAWIKFNNTLKDSFKYKFKDISNEYTKNIDTYYIMAIARLNECGKELLLIIDDANTIQQEDINVIRSLQCRVLITSRSEISGIKIYDIKHMDETSCVNMYKKYRDEVQKNDVTDGNYLLVSGDDAEESAIREIVRLAVYHTITIELLAKLQSADWTTARELLKELKYKGFTLKGNDTTIETSEVVEKTISEHLSIIFNISNIKDDEAKWILGLFSLLAANIPIDVHIAKELLEIKNLNTLNKLVKYGWISRENKSCVSMHPVISDVVRSELKPNYKCAELMIKNFVKATANARRDYTNMKDILHHGVFVLSYFYPLNQTEDIADLLYNIGVIYIISGAYSEAKRYFENALEIYEKVGNENKKIADTIHGIGKAYHLMGEYNLSLKYCNKALSIREKIFGTDSIDASMSYHDIGSIYSSKLDYIRALELLKKSLNIRIEKLGKINIDTANSYNEIAIVYLGMSDVSTALKYLQTAMKIRKIIFGKNHPETAKIYDNMANVYLSMHKLSMALKYHQIAMDISVNILGNYHPFTATVYANIADVYREMGDYCEAMEYYMKAKEIDDKILGKNHFYAAINYNNIGVLYYMMNRYRDALDYFKKALSVFKYHFGNEHRATVATRKWIKIAEKAIKSYGTL